MGGVLPNGSRNTHDLTVPALEPEHIRGLVATARVAHLGSVDPESGVHIVPVTFALIGDTIVTAVDQKPKQSRRLRRVANIERNHNVTVLVDHYDEDWTKLWWCRLSGRARVVYQGNEFERAVEALVARYGQYRTARPRGPVIRVDVSRWVGWAAAEP